jgi:hypothetical protein
MRNTLDAIGRAARRSAIVVVSTLIVMVFAATAYGAERHDAGTGGHMSTVGAFFTVHQYDGGGDAGSGGDAGMGNNGGGSEGRGYGTGDGYHNAF